MCPAVCARGADRGNRGDHVAMECRDRRVTEACPRLRDRRLGREIGRDRITRPARALDHAPQHFLRTTHDRAPGSTPARIRAGQSRAAPAIWADCRYPTPTQSPPRAGCGLRRSSEKYAPGIHASPVRVSWQAPDETGFCCTATALMAILVHDVRSEWLRQPVSAYHRNCYGFLSDPRTSAPSRWNASHGVGASRLVTGRRRTRAEADDHVADKTTTVGVGGDCVSITLASTASVVSPATVHARARSRRAPDAAESIAMPCATMVRYTWYNASSGRRSVLTTTPSSADAAGDGLTRVGSPTQAEQAKAASETSRAARMTEPQVEERSATMVDRPTCHRVRRGATSGFPGAPSASAGIPIVTRHLPRCGLTPATVACGPPDAARCADRGSARQQHAS